MKKRVLALALTFAMAIGLAACGGASSTASSSEAQSETAGESAGGEASGSSTVVVAMGSGFSTLDPGYVYEKFPPLIVNACYETLFKFYSNDGAAEPNLVDSYEFSEDNLTLT